MMKFFGCGGSHQKGLTIANARKGIAQGMRSSVQRASALGSRLGRTSFTVLSSSRRSIGGADRRNSVKSRLNRHHVVDGVEPKEQACVVLYLNEETWEGSRGEMLADEVERMLDDGIEIAMVHEQSPARGAVEFGDIIRNTPPRLVKDRGLYSKIAQAWPHGETHRLIGIKMSAKGMGAKTLGPRWPMLTEIRQTLSDRITGRKTTAPPRLQRLSSSASDQQICSKSSPKLNASGPSSFVLPKDGSRSPKGAKAAPSRILATTGRVRDHSTSNRSDNASPTRCRPPSAGSLGSGLATGGEASANSTAANLNGSSKFTPPPGAPMLHLDKSLNRVKVNMGLDDDDDDDRVSSSSAYEGGVGVEGTKDSAALTQNGSKVTAERPSSPVSGDECSGDSSFTKAHHKDKSDKRGRSSCAGESPQIGAKRWLAAHEAQPDLRSAWTEEENESTIETPKRGGDMSRSPSTTSGFSPTKLLSNIASNLQQLLPSPTLLPGATESASARKTASANQKAALASSAESQRRAMQARRTAHPHELSSSSNIHKQVDDEQEQLGDVDLTMSINDRATDGRRESLEDQSEPALAPICEPARMPALRKALSTCPEQQYVNGKPCRASLEEWL